MTARTTAEHRAELEAWRATAPADDIEILATIVGKPKKEKRPRHRDLAQLDAILAFHRRPDGVAEAVQPEPAAPVKTNWSLTPANDNRAPEDGSGREQAVEYIPSIPAIEAAMGTIEMRYRAEPMMKCSEVMGLVYHEWESRRAGREVHGIVTGGDVEYGWHVTNRIDENGDQHEKKHRTITRIGRLRFSDGTQTERGEKLSMGQVVASRIEMPVGAMLGCREKATRDKGAVQDPVELAYTMDYFAGKNDPPGLFDAQLAGRVKKKPRSFHTGPKTKEEARQWLADAIANTPVMPPVKKCTDGFPAGPRNLADLFPGLVKVATGGSGSQAWDGIASALEERNEWHAVLQGMKEEHVETLTRASNARSLRELGEIRGSKGKYAIAAGRRLLIAANDNYLAARKLAEEARAA
ncbi:hypothetical protein [Shinella sp. M31]|uniref:hypothetical protein n=1 Tax=Shinella sp. M31 TaxID=3368615 RepID=UPI003BA29302